MSDQPTVRRGRRPSSSRAALEDAAGELFLENSYQGTTIEQITQRAGVSRASFFNYFPVKSDLLWGDVDLVIDDLSVRLDSCADGPDPVRVLCETLVDAASAVGSSRIPLAVTQWDAMGARDEVISSGLARFGRLARLLRDRLGRSRPSSDPVLVSAAALALAGAVAAAAAEWAAAGVGRDDLGSVVVTAVGPVREGFAPRLR